MEYTTRCKGFICMLPVVVFVVLVVVSIVESV